MLMAVAHNGSEWAIGFSFTPVCADVRPCLRENPETWGVPGLEGMETKSTPDVDAHEVKVVVIGPHRDSQACCQYGQGGVE